MTCSKLHSNCVRSLKGQAFGDQDKVYIADTVNFYRLVELEDNLAGYLARVGKQEVFERLRYAALNRPQVAFRDVPLSQVYFELVAVMTGLRSFWIANVPLSIAASGVNR